MSATTEDLTLMSDADLKLAMTAHSNLYLLGRETPAQRKRSAALFAEYDRRNAAPEYHGASDATLADLSLYESEVSR